jgi:hypothetical protein
MTDQKWSHGYRADPTAYKTTKTQAHVMQWGNVDVGAWWSLCGNVTDSSQNIEWASKVEPGKPWCQTCVRIAERIVHDLQVYVIGEEES